ncbi:hypothetical protein V8F20_011302 [Naviculisporaceae sp. PSN 640]
MSKRLSISGLVRLGHRRSSNASTSTNEPTGPPAYTTVRQDQPPPADLPTAEETERVNLTAAFDNLKLTSNNPGSPTPETCLAHLKLLFALHSMKEEVGYTDGLFGLWDSLAGPPAVFKALDEKTLEEKAQDKQLAVLSKIREKRWAMFVARAVDRYQAWWKSMPASPLTEGVMADKGAGYYSTFATDASQAMKWNANMLPPLDVLMVWHTHMLNPRAFLEDSLLTGLRGFWAGGMPWDVVNQAIDNAFNYALSDECKAHWVAQTGLSWENADDPNYKSLKCPRCSTSLMIPWTTCSLPESHPPPASFDESQLVGNGYGDGNLNHSCHRCNLTIRKELLAVSKFVKDAQSLLGTENRPMPGTVLDPQNGTPVAIPNTFPENLRFPQTFPNRLLKSGANMIRSTITSLISSSKGPTGPTMEDVRLLIESILKDNSLVKEVDSVSGISPRITYRLPPGARIATRKMMSRYWENFSPFALDLAGAVIRQGVFIAKMYRIDWLHSPSANDTMKRLLIKYGRFFEMMSSNPGKVCVPTLDVDLAWHTHQLSPPAYFAHATSKCHGKFIDHDDKINEDTLSAQFEWTSKTYQEKYGEVYSECTCWYCEAIRASHISSVSSALGLSRQERIAENFHDTQAAGLCPPDRSAHISAHNAVRTQYADGLETLAKRTRVGDDTAWSAQLANTRRRVMAQMAALHKKRVEEGYKRAKKRAEKKGRTIPARGKEKGLGAEKEEDMYHDHWGYPYYYYWPGMYAMWLTPGLYYGWYPGYVAGCGGGSWGACAAGSCGGGVAAGACGGPGGCGGDGGAGGDGAGGSCGGAGGCGGDGGGGSGGGGGCGGGGGGGGCGGGGC